MGKNAGPLYRAKSGGYSKKPAGHRGRKSAGWKVGWSFQPLPSVGAPTIRAAKDGRQVFNARTFPTPGATKVDSCRVGEHKAGCFTDDGTQIKARKGERLTAEVCEVRGGSVFVPKKAKELRAGKTEVEFISGKQAASYGLSEGAPLAVMRMCWGAQQRGRVVPVATPEEAQRLGHEFEKCAARGNPEACAEKLAEGKKSALAGIRRKSSRRGR